MGGANNDFTYRIIYRENAFIVCGLTTNIGGGFGDAFILKVDTLGNQQWFKTFGETDQKEAFTTLAPTNDGGFVCGGFISPPGSQISDFWLVKFDENGEEEWSEFYGGTLNEYVMSVLETIDGGIAAVGDKERSDGSYNAWLIKTDGAGNLLWDTDLMQTYNTGSRGMVTDADGDFYITGESDPIGAGFLDIYLAKVSSAGSVQWQKQIGGNRGDAGFHIAHPVPGRLLITGYGYNPRDENQDAVVVVTDTYGNVDTTLYYGDPSVEIGYHIFPSVYGGFLVASASFQADNQYFLIYDDLPILAGIEQNPPSFSTRIKLFPNPVSSSGTVFLNTSVFHPQITLTDVAGRILFDKKFDGQITDEKLSPTIFTK